MLSERDRPALLLGLMILQPGVGGIRRQLIRVLPLPALTNRIPPALPAILSAG